LAQGDSAMILIGLGSNLHGPWGSPQETLERALAALNTHPMSLVRVSSIIVTKPFGRENQPHFANAVAQISTHLSPDALMRRLHLLERRAGRQRRVRWGPRSLDLDLLDYHGLVRSRATRDIKPLTLPHPGLPERLFVLEPIAAIAPRWRHPLTRETASFTVRKLNRLSAI
jgi:2-amino-4-hydroxy-6-hydroxymethyldihydropteridine diphosphokinase